ncbi:hypothetical protein Dsin_003160 [Dipteronia sinensis]|uniref:DUF659 domain-containing protein n=1 Tax=Dipteronia sinensis TaxID=43782 RepID=A0AAE0EKC8_9ROSI|nr:hypothetical protein Dsin_003160 [Dipteronia sinensis]
MSTDQTSNSNQKKDPAWRYFTCPNESKGGIFRVKQHLAEDSSDVTHCRQVPEPVKEEIISYMLKKKNDKEGRNLTADYDDDIIGIGVGDDDDDLAMVCSQKRSMSSLGRSGSGSESGSNNESSFKKPKQKGPLDLYYNKTPLRKIKLGETKAVKEELRDHVCKTFARWMYDTVIIFNAVKYPSFKPFYEVVGQYGSGVKLLSYHEVRVPLLKKEVELTRKAMKVHDDEWKAYGCSILSDGWMDRRERTVINFLVNSPRGSVFVESVDAPAYAKTGEKIFELLSQFVEKIGVSNVVQVVTDSASNIVLAEKYLEAKYENLFWTPCAAHCLDLILEDIFKLKRMKQTFERAVMVNSYIYGRTGVVNMLRKYTNMKELPRPAKTRFAIAFIMLSIIHSQKTNLRKIFTSDEWSLKQWAKEAAVKKVMEVILMPSFRNNIVFAFKIANPFVKVLRLVDERLVPDVETRCQIDLDLAKYKKAEGLFGSPMGVKMRGKKSPAEWWDSYGTFTPALQKFAIKIFSLTCGSSGCERN